MDLLLWFEMGGQFMTVILLAGIISSIALLSMAYTANKFQQTSFLAVIAMIIFGPILIGLAGYYLGYQEAYSAVANADPSMKEELLAESNKIAQIPLIFGVGISLVLAFQLLILKKFKLRD